VIVTLGGKELYNLPVKRSYLYDRFTISGNNKQLIHEMLIDLHYIVPCLLCSHFRIAPDDGLRPPRALESRVAKCSNIFVFNSTGNAQLSDTLGEVKSFTNELVDIGPLLKLANNVGGELFLAELFLGIGAESKEADKGGEDDGLNGNHDELRMKVDWESDEGTNRERRALG